MPSDNITLVSGYWDVHSKHAHTDYEAWFKNSLKINQRMIFFCEKETIPMIQKYRGDLETIFVEYKIKDFYCNAFYNSAWVNQFEIPSEELGKIWHEKLRMVKLAMERDGDCPTDFYVWYDAGNCVFRNEKPPAERLNLKDPKLLPSTKISYSESYPPEENHQISGTVLIIPKDLVNNAHDIFYRFVHERRSYREEWKYGSDQVILTEIFKIYPRMFYKVSNGYGENIRVIYTLAGSACNCESHDAISGIIAPPADKKSKKGGCGCH